MSSDTYTIPSENEALSEESGAPTVKYEWLQNHMRQFERRPKLDSAQPSGEQELINREPRSDRAELMGGSALQEAGRAFEARSLEVDDIATPDELAKTAELTRRAEVKHQQMESAKKIYILGRAIEYARSEELKGYLFNDN